MGYHAAPPRAVNRRFSILLPLAITAATLTRSVGPAFEFIGTYPINSHPGWTLDLQGVTHDSSFWFFTQPQTIWRFPVGHDLDVIELPRPGRMRVEMPAELARAGYDHFGALAYHEGLLLVPVTGSAPPALLAVFRANDLKFLGQARLSSQQGAGWVAVGANGRIYSSHASLDGTLGLLGYTVDWKLFASGGLPRSPASTEGQVDLWPDSRIPLLDETGEPVSLRSMQGGVFDGAERFYAMNGYCRGITGETGLSAFVIQADTGRRILQSTDRPGPYQFEFHPGHRGLFWCRQEPEGLTVWDLDDGRAPGIRGQLHVIMVDNVLWDAGGWYFRHYRIRS